MGLRGRVLAGKTGTRRSCLLSRATWIRNAGSRWKTARMPHRQTGVWHGSSWKALAALAISVAAGFRFHSMRFGSMCLYANQAHRRHAPAPRARMLCG
eukprot:1815917-Pleurochrysis_carterae.AAC.1